MYMVAKVIFSATYFVFVVLLSYFVLFSNISIKTDSLVLLLSSLPGSKTLIFFYQGNYMKLSYDNHH